MTAPTRRRFLAGAGATAGVALLPWGGRALTAPQEAAQPRDVPVTGDPAGLSPFGFMFPLLDPLRPDPDPGVTIATLASLAGSMLDPNVTQPAPGNRDNVGALGSALTYFGQFIDHDLTLDLEPQPTRFFGRSAAGLLLDDDDARPVLNQETFRFDLSSVYGGGPDLSPQLYEADGVHFRVQEPNANGVRDLPRNPDGSAILVEHRNDENQIIAQVHIAFLRFHNAVADAMNTGFAATRAAVIRYYQWAVIHQFLPEICGQALTDRYVAGVAPPVYRPGSPLHPMTPVEWSVAAYRFGHSIVRKAYEVTNATGKLQVFNGTDADLHGGRPLGPGRQIDWGNFVAPLRRADNVAHFNFPRFVDPLISSGLFNLPIGGLPGAENAGSNVLGFRNLVRGLFYGLPSGQDVAAALGAPVLSVADIAAQYPAAAVFSSGTPLWFYVLADADLNAGGLHLGPVGGAIVADVFTGLLTADPDGLLHDATPDHGGWRPAPPIAPAAGQFGLEDLLTFAGVAVRP